MNAISRTYTLAEVRDAANAAADDVIEAIENEEGFTDLVNLVVNVTLHYLEHSDSDLSGAVGANYDENLETVLDWIR